MKFRIRRPIPRLTGSPQLVDFQGAPMRIVSTASSSGPVCRTVTLTLVDEAHFQDPRFGLPTREDR